VGKCVDYEWNWVYYGTIKGSGDLILLDHDVLEGLVQDSVRFNEVSFGFSANSGGF